MGNISDPLLEDICRCTKCATLSRHQKFRMDAHGDKNAEFILVGEAPAKESLLNNKYWTGRAGELLRSALGEVGITLEDSFYMTDVVKCWPQSAGQNRKPSWAEINNCLPHLYREIRELGPKLVIAVGKTASEALLGRPINVTKSNGEVFNCRGTRVLVLVHPSYALRKGGDSQYVRDLQSAVAKHTMGGEQTNIAQNGRDRVFPTETEVEKSEGERTFYLPAEGNSITANDIKRRQVRITRELKKYFPSADCFIDVYLSGGTYQAKFIHRDGRSHIVRFQESAFARLGIREGGRLRVTLVGDVYCFDVAG